VGVGEQHRKFLQRIGQSVPSPLPLQFLIDTGASCSWVDEMHMRSLGLQPRSWAEVHTVTGGGIATEFPAYEVGITLGGQASPNTRRFQLLIGGQPFINQPFDGLIGRDILNVCRIGWNGPAREIRIDYE
tara:strand:+ start:610 stop:999 length:390 start_codon:yes stop_codon:yes gene_type:complete